MAEKYEFGEKLREVRERRGMTMKEVAEKAGVSESLVSQIERNKVSPAIDTLLGLVEALGIDIEFLFRDFKRDRSVNLVRKADRRKLLLRETVYEQLSRTVEEDSEHGIEAYFLELAPGGEKGSELYGHPGKELGVIMEGAGTFSIGTRKYELAAGDSISFSADSPHLLKNTGTGPLKAFWVVTPPKGFFPGDE